MGATRPRGGPVALAGLIGLAVSGVAIAVSEATEPGAISTNGAAPRIAHSHRRSRAAPRRSVTLGRSVRGRPIRAVVLGPSNARAPVLVVGCIHGNEPAGIAVADRLAHARIPPRSSIWIVRDLSPDGVAAGTRQNAHGVDLNRNFPYAWAPVGAPGDLRYNGPGPLSEPESRIAATLILRLRPRITIWFHQHEEVTDTSGGIRIEQRFAILSGLPLRRLARYPGSATRWQDHRLTGATAFVVELPAGRLSAGQTKRIANAVLALAS
jgi:murein peptide amidase A